MAREFDLLGDPIPATRGRPGRDEHVATASNVNKVRLLVLADWTAKQIAEEIGVSVPTLNKHYFRNGSIKRARETVLAEVKGRLMLQLDAEAAKGNVSAMKKLADVVAKEELRAIQREMQDKPTKPKAKKLGKKEQRLVDAAEPDETWSFLDQVDRPN